MGTAMGTARQKLSGWFAEQGAKAPGPTKRGVGHDMAKRILAEARERLDSKGQGKGKNKEKPKSGRHPRGKD
eukprot:3416609-Pyramimonas_sp.AAC.1